MALDSVSIVDAVASHASASGWFERVIKHEPKVAPGNGLSASIWTDRIEPHAESSGLAATSVRLILSVRVAMNMLFEPQDDIDPKVLGGAVDALMNAYSGDFALGGLIKNVDLLGEGARGMSAQAGYLDQDHKLYRVMTINLPLVVSDVWEQVP